MNLIKHLFNRLNQVWNRSIRRQLAWSFSLTALSIMLGSGYLLFCYQRNFQYAQGTESALGLAQALSFSSVSWVLADDVVGLQEVLKGATQTKDIKFAAVLTPQGEVLAATRPEYIGRLFSDAISQRLLELPSEPHILLDASNLIDVAVPIKAGNRPIGWARIELTRDTANANLREIAAAGLGIAVFLLLMIAIIATWMARRLTSGLERLTRVALNTEHGLAFQREEMQRADEIGVLARQMYRMLDAIDEEKKARFESALYARILIEASLDPLVTIGADGKIMDVNAATENVTGIARGALIGSDFSDYFTEPKKARAGYQLVFEQGSVTDYPLVIRHASGNLIEVLYNATLYRDAQGKVAGVFAAARDITERKKMEDELKRSNAELDQFAYAVSHDMRQPLRMVSSYLSLLEKNLAGQLDEDTGQYLMHASEGAKRMDQMILAMLDFSRVGRKTDPIIPLSSREVLDNTLAMLNPDIIAGAATVEVTGDWPELAASRDELMRLLQNLIGNALKYHEPEQPPRVEIHADATPTLFRVTIRDHGIGIDPKQTDRLFKVFSRLQARTRFEGTGVGLALCRKIVEHHGGRIGAESAGEGQGSTFWFELPRTPAHDAVIPAEPE